VEQIDLLKFAVDALDRLAIPYALVGSFASGVWGESRFTQDIDLLIQVEFDQVDRLCDAFAGPDFYVSKAAAQEAVSARSQFNVIHPASGNKIDFMIVGRSAWSTSQLQRRKRVPLFPNHETAVAAPEDVILGKLVYYREGGSDKHLRDIAGILKISNEFVDRDYVARFAAQLGVADVWQAVIDRFESN
jgi:hypothetical protein